MPVYETLLARYLDELGILRDMHLLSQQVLSVTMILNYLAAAAEKAFESAEELAKFIKRREGLWDNIEISLNAGKGLELRMAVLRSECDAALSRVGTLRLVYDIIEEQNEIPLSEIR